MSLAKALPENVKVDIAGQELEFRRIGLDVWSSFSDFVVEKRSKRIHSLPIENAEKALMLKELAKEGVDMLGLLTEAQSLDGMVEIVTRCCVTKGMKQRDLIRLIPIAEVGSLFSTLSDIEEAEEEEGEVGNDSSGPKTGAS